MTQRIILNDDDPIIQILGTKIKVVLGDFVLEVESETNNSTRCLYGNCKIE